MSQPKPFAVAANWKMYKSPQQAGEFLARLIPRTKDLPQHRQLIIFPSAFSVPTVQLVLRGTTIGWGAQNVHHEKEGAFTGENSPSVLKELGATHALVGHSERRTLFGETDQVIARKVAILQELDILPMLCVGESLSEREAGKTADVIRRQLREGLSRRQPAHAFMVAYEPVWAIGTGKVASPEQAEEAHQILRKELEGIGGAALAKSTMILYGGSVKPDNAKALFSQKSVDGFLVGGASLEVDKFLELAHVH